MAIKPKKPFGAMGTSKARTQRRKRKKSYAGRARMDAKAKKL